ncbi:hypothetical protein SADUNF_Sadunf16G0284400 [Salix dunnii]|uniref:Aminotransferase-like plant mobile domain-containing protein n=1 Tax=Salix dunnii TaxID=1413687 RepID=A0A835JAY1_9ROSI|nr:hypothetical protein SADUNF_Sadunf16G0284400 [Salix dunnii]
MVLKDGIHTLRIAILDKKFVVKDVILGLLEYWCPETNTFVFPWGDIVNLVGPSVLGELVTKPCGDSVKKR